MAPGLFADEDAVAPALDELAKRMKKRELAVLLVPREQAAGLVGVTMPDEVKGEWPAQAVQLSCRPGQGAGQASPAGRADAADAAVEVEAEMLEFVKDRMTWQLADAERLPFAEAKKNSGNHWFKAGDLDRALVRGATRQAALLGALCYGSHGTATHVSTPQKRYQKGCEALDFEQDAPPEAADLKVRRVPRMGGLPLCARGSCLRACAPSPGVVHAQPGGRAPQAAELPRRDPVLQGGPAPQPGQHQGAVPQSPGARPSRVSARGATGWRAGPGAQRSHRHVHPRRLASRRDLDQAVLDLQSALQSQPDEATARSIQAELRRVQHELRESSRKQDFFARMFQA